MSTSTRLPPPLTLPCPLCAHPHFESAQMLRDRLIFVSTHNLTCPICNEEVIGMDKLTIHLFCHVKLIDKNDSEAQNNKKSDKVVPDKPQVCKRARTQAKNKTITSAKVPVKFVKIFPKLPLISLNTMPLIEITHKPIADNTNNPLRMMTVATSSEIAPKQYSSEDGIIHKCEICSVKFADENILKMHKVLIHSYNTETSEISNIYQCHLCNKNFKMKGSLMVHLRVAHYGFPSGSNVINNTTEDLATPASANIPEIVTNEKPSVVERHENKQCFCEVCKKTFTTKYFLKKHKRLHTGETPYSCVQCNKTFTFQQSYHKHLLYHNDEKPHSCSYCGRSFKELSTLHNHQRIHTGEKPFSCETCGKCFRQRVSYLVHRRIHTGVMPYKCTACDKSFRYKVSQRTHKCPAQPPGTVVRQSGELLEKLKKKHSGATVHQEDNPNDIYSSVSEASAELIRTGAKLSFEDTESENFSLISKQLCTIESNNNQYREGNSLSDIDFDRKTISDKTTPPHLNNSVGDLEVLMSTSSNVEKSVPSPTDILKNLCITSYDEDFTANNLPKSSCLSNEDINFDVMYREFDNFL